MDDHVTEELIARAKEGDREAFNALVRATYQKVHALALRLTGNEHDADDVVQDTYVRAFRGLRRFRGDARFTTWLHRITANSASTHIVRRSRDRKRHRELTDDLELVDGRVDFDPERHAEAAASGTRLERALGLLPARLKSVVVLRDIHGMSHREIAERLDITESAAKVRLHRARRRLRESLGSITGDRASDSETDTEIETDPVDRPETTRRSSETSPADITPLRTASRRGPATDQAPPERTASQV